MRRIRAALAGAAILASSFGLLSAVSEAPASANQTLYSACVATVRDNVQSLTNCDYSSASGTARVAVYGAGGSIATDVTLTYHWGYGIICVDIVFGDPHGTPGITYIAPLNWKPNECQSASPYGIRLAGVRWHDSSGYYDQVGVLVYGAHDWSGYRSDFF